MITTPAQRTAGLIRARKVLGMTKRRRPMPRDRFPTLVAMEYTRALWRLFERVPPAFAELFARLPGLLESARATRGDGAMWEPVRADLPLGRQSLVPSENALRLDAGEGREVRDLVRRAREAMAETIDDSAIENVAREFVDRTSTEQRKAILRQTRAAFGVEVPTTDAGIAGTLEAHVQANVGLIKDVTDEVARKIEAVVLAGVQDGRLAGDLQGDIRKVFAAGKERLQLIAVDQVGKTYSDVTFLRHQELGVEKFTWRTSRDSRVRGNPAGKYPKATPSHHAREGVVYAYDDLPKGKGGERERPGKPVRCRCTAEPVFDDILEGLDDEPLPVPPVQLPAQRAPRSPAVAPILPRVPAPPPIAKRGDLDVSTLRGSFGAVPQGADLNGLGGQTMRAHLNASIRPYGLHNSDAALPLRNKIEVTDEIGFVGGVHEFDGRIRMAPEIADNLATFATDAAAGRDFAADMASADPERANRAFQGVEAYRTFTHEAIHGHGPAFYSSFLDGSAGVAIEEAVTEVAARRVVRDRLGFGLHASDEGVPGVWVWGVDGPNYAEHIDPIRDGIASVLQTDAKTAYRIVEEASLAYKRTKKPTANPDEAIDRFLESLPLEGPDDYQGAVRSSLRTYFRRLWPA